MERRRVLKLGAAAILGAALPAHGADDFMRRAFELRRLALERGDQPYGAVVDLSGAEMYGTSRACPMCEAAAYWAGISRLWYGESIAGGDAPRLR